LTASLLTLLLWAKLMETIMTPNRQMVGE